jgi:hypothetical protein
VATVSQSLDAEAAQFLSSAFPALRKAGTNIPVMSLAYDATNNQGAFWRLPALNFGSGNLTVEIFWYAATATSGDVVFGAALAAITADTDTGSTESKSLATEQTVTDTHLGTTAQRLHKASLTLSNTDSIAAGDECWLKLRRLSSGNSLSGLVHVVEVRVSYSDT